MVDLRKVRALLRFAALCLYVFVVAKWLGVCASWGDFGFLSTCGSWLMCIASARFANQRRWLSAHNLAQMTLFVLSGGLLVLAFWAYVGGSPQAVFMPRMVVSVVLLKVSEHVMKHGVTLK